MQDQPHHPRRVGRPPDPLDPASSLRARLGAELRQLRQAKSLSLAALAKLVGSSASHLSDMEHGRKLPSIGLVEHLDEVFGTDGALLALFPSAVLEQTVERHKHARNQHVRERESDHLSPILPLEPSTAATAWDAVLQPSTARQGRPEGQSSQAAGIGPEHDFRAFVLDKWPKTRLSKPVPDYGVDWSLLLPIGRTLPGSVMNVQLQESERDNNAVVVVRHIDRSRLEQCLQMPNHAVIAGAERTSRAQKFYMLGAAEARRQTINCPSPRVTLHIPRAYELDNFTYAILWAVSCLDDSLLADDSILSQCWRKLREYETLSQPAVSRKVVADASSIGQLWIGSDFCARYILRRVGMLTEVPLFWTRGQRGEDASLWLFVRHKYDYLTRIKSHFSAQAAPLSRTFCVPEESVGDSPTWERILLFLSVALMESLRIHVHVCTEPEYSRVAGFVLAPDKLAIIASWIRSDEVWYADVTDRAVTLNEYMEYLKYAQSRSAISAPTAYERLERLAGYLELDWKWVAHRSMHVGRHGCGALIQPRSRLLSTVGLETTCRFVGNVYRAFHRYEPSRYESEHVIAGEES